MKTEWERLFQGVQRRQKSLGYEVERVRGLPHGLRSDRRNLLLRSVWRGENRKEVIHFEGTRVGGAEFEVFVGN